MMTHILHQYSVPTCDDCGVRVSRGWFACPACGSRLPHPEPSNELERAAAALDRVLLRLPVAPMSLIPAYVSWFAAITLLILPAATTDFTAGVVFPSLALIELMQFMTYPGLMELSVAASFVYVDVAWAVGMLVLVFRGSQCHVMVSLGRLQWQSAPVETRQDLMQLGLALFRTALGWPAYVACGTVAAFCYCAAEAGMGRGYVVALLLIIASAVPLALLGDILGRMWFQYVVCTSELNVAIDNWFRAMKIRYAKPKPSSTSQESN